MHTRTRALTLAAAIPRARTGLLVACWKNMGTSGAAFGGPLSGADTNAALNATGLVGIDSLLDGGTEKKKKKKKIEV